MLGIKIGTGVEDVPAARRGLGEEYSVVWGIGDVSSAVAGGRSAFGSVMN